MLACLQRLPHSRVAILCGVCIFSPCLRPNAGKNKSGEWADQKRSSPPGGKKKITTTQCARGQQPTSTRMKNLMAPSPLPNCDDKQVCAGDSAPPHSAFLSCRSQNIYFSIKYSLKQKWFVSSSPFCLTFEITKSRFLCFLGQKPEFLMNPSHLLLLMTKYR